MCNTQINISAHKQIFQSINKLSKTLRKISIHYKVYFDSPQRINRYATRYSKYTTKFNTFEMTQQNVIRYTTKNCSQYATESLDTQQKIAYGNFRDYGEFSCISLYSPVYQSLRTKSRGWNVNSCVYTVV